MGTRPPAEGLTQAMLFRGLGDMDGWRPLELRTMGAYGIVYRAESVLHPGAGPFALKVALHPMDARFLREAHLLRLAHHPHVPRLYASALWQHPSGPFPYLVMEWIEGVPLYARVPGAPSVRGSCCGRWRRWPGR